MAKKEIQDPIQAALESYEAFAKTLQTKKYSFKVTESTLSDLKEFFYSEIAWKFNESVGVEKAYTLLNEASKEFKNNEIWLDSLTLQALYVFISRKEGKGFEEAKKFHNDILKPISETIKRIKGDEQIQQDLYGKYMDLKEGLAKDTAEAEAVPANTEKVSE